MPCVWVCKHSNPMGDPKVSSQGSEISSSGIEGIGAKNDDGQPGEGNLRRLH